MDRNKLIGLSGIVNRTGLCRTTVYRKRNEDGFPLPVAYCPPHCPLWNSDDIDRWISESGILNRKKRKKYTFRGGL